MYCKFHMLNTLFFLLFCINSSKVYCKFFQVFQCLSAFLSINSSKVYCKSHSVHVHTLHKFVLIVAKCIVNVEDDAGKKFDIEY